MVDAVDEAAGTSRGVTGLARPDRELTPGIRLADALELDVLAGARVVAGHAGLERLVTRLNVMEVPDILPWVRSGELLLTTGYPLRQTPERLTVLVRDLVDLGLAGLAIKLGRYLDELPQEACREADRLGLPLILLPDDVGFDDVINRVLAVVLDRQAMLLARSEEVLRDLVDIVIGGGDLQDVCRELVDTLPGSALVTTIDGRVIASVVADDGTVADLQRYECFDRTGRFRVEDVPVGHTGEGAVTRIVSRVSAGRLDQGRLVVLGERLSDEEVPIVDRAAAAAALVLTKHDAVAAVESKYRADFLRDALAGRAGPAARVVQHADSLGWDLDRRLLVVVAEVDADAATASSPPSADEERSQQQRFAAAWSQVVLGRDEGAAVVGFGQEVVAVVGVDPAPRPRSGGGGVLGPDGEGSETDQVTGAVSEFVRSVRGIGGGGRRSFSTGVSRVVDSVESLPQAYEQARKAVSVGRRMHGGQSVAHFDGLGVFRLLSLVPDPEELRAFAAETLGELATDASDEYADLRRTLATLLENNLNVAETARHLHFHYNTLRYRIGKLERMVGPFTTDPHLRLTLSLALQVVQMRGI